MFSRITNLAMALSAVAQLPRVARRFVARQYAEKRLNDFLAGYALLSDANREFVFNRMAKLLFGQEGRFSDDFAEVRHHDLVYRIPARGGGGHLAWIGRSRYRLSAMMLR